MKIVFNRQGKKHVCSTYFRQFDWDENSWAYYGKSIAVGGAKDN